MSEYEVLGIEAMILDAGSKQYSNTFVIPEVIRDGVKVLDLCGFSDVELDSDDDEATLESSGFNL